MSSVEETDKNYSKRIKQYIDNPYNMYRMNDSTGAARIKGL